MANLTLIRGQAVPFQVMAVSEPDDYFNEHNIKTIKESIAQMEAGDVVVKTMAELETMKNG
jgi:hypothetical protein